jgi:uncharacterized protein involved in response to NO
MDGNGAVRPARMTGKPQPFRPFFLLAGLDAVFGAAVWIPFASGAGIVGASGVSAGDWHRNMLLFGTVPDILAGFLLTALPRWTGRPAAPAAVSSSFVALWLCGRCSAVFLSQAMGLALAALFVLALALLAASYVIASRDRRNLKIVLLLLIFCASAGMTAASIQLEFALRAALASVIGLVLVIGGRVVPALTAAFVQSAGGHIAIRPSRVVERTAAIAAACALGGWVVAPQASIAGLACAVAACTQAMRAAQWRVWREHASASVLALHAGYGWVIVGFALLAIHILAPGSLGRAAAIHAWTIGAVGTMGLAIMASMIRRHSGQAFMRSASATAAFVAMTASCVSRLLAELSPDAAEPWTTLSAALWIAAFALFLAAFHRTLLPRA